MSPSQANRNSSELGHSSPMVLLDLLSERSCSKAWAYAIVWRLRSWKAFVIRQLVRSGSFWTPRTVYLVSPIALASALWRYRKADSWAFWNVSSLMVDELIDGLPRVRLWLVEFCSLAQGADEMIDLSRGRGPLFRVVSHLEVKQGRDGVSC